ncbi:hypothetical protein PFISCL1PPCAC_13750, partial [Pristionchus fissidentatus]
MLRTLMQGVICSEAGLGILLNLFVVRIIERLSDRTLQHYRVCLLISTIHAILYSIINIVCVVTHVIDRDAVYSSLNGLVLFFPHWLADVSIITWVFLAVMSWTTLPATFMMQFMIIVRHSMPTWTILSYIYAICFLISCPIFVTVKDALPLPSFIAELEPTVRNMYSLTSEDRVLVYGGSLFPRAANGNRSFAYYTFIGIGLTFVVSYGLALFCVRRILRAIREQTANNTGRSEKSLNVQRRFVIMLILEATVPFFFLGVAVGVFTLAGLAGVKLGLHALIMSVSVAAVPAIQALLYLLHLGRSRSADSSAPRAITCSA